MKELLKKALIFILKFWEWRIWTPAFWKGRTEYYIGFLALVAWLLFEAGGRYLGWQTAPVGSFQKISFGILGMSIIAGVSWLWLSSTFPNLKKLIDPDSLNLNDLTTWQQIKLALSFFVIYAFGALLLASLY